jgi:hypothetical protein
VLYLVLFRLLDAAAAERAAIEASERELQIIEAEGVT